MCVDTEGCSAEEMTQWVKDSYVAVRTVMSTPWRRFEPSPISEEIPF